MNMEVGTGRSLAIGVVALALFAGTTLAAAARPEQRDAQVVFVTAPCTVPDFDFLCPPFLRALRRTGVQGKIIAPAYREDIASTLSLLAKQGYALIIVWPGGNFDEWTAALGNVARRFPQARFALLEFPLSVLGRRTTNVQSILIRTHEASYLAGWLAVRLEQRRPGRDVVGAVGGLEGIQTVEDFMVGFRAGAKGASPKATVLVGYSQDFVDTTKCEAIARRQIARGAGALFNVAGGCGLGTLRAAKRAGIWGIGVDTDQSFLGPHILTSVVKGWDVMMLTLLRQVRDGRIRARGQIELGLADGGATLGRLSPKVPASLRRELADMRRRIVAGEIRVPGVPPR